MNNYDKLYNVLKTNPALVTEDGDLLKNKVQELARKMDTSLLTTLLSDTFTEEMFFVNVNDIKVFDANKFTHIVESQAFLPDSYTRFKQNIMLTDGSRPIRKSGDVVLEFPYKDCVLEFDSTDTDTTRDEVFLNETLMKNEIDTLLDHKAFCNATRYTVDGVTPATDISMNDNLIIKGNNLLALHTLYPKYSGQIKLMYWDILYNTDNDQVPYNDSFKHTSWLTMMDNRLKIAQKLLRKDGVICIHCDKNEDAYLKVLCDEIFGRDNFVNHICIKSSTASGTKTAHKEKTIIKLTDTLLVYKNGENIKINPQFERRTKWDTHFAIWIEKMPNGTIIEKPLIEVLKEKGIVNEKTTLGKLDINDSVFKRFYIENATHIGQYSSHKCNGAKEYAKEHPDVVFEYEDKGFFKNNRQFSPLSVSLHTVLGTKSDENDFAILLGDVWTDIDFNNTQNEGNNSLPSGKKPELLIRRIISMFTAPNDIVLDAYLGSGTTAAVAHKMGRRYIGIEQLDSHSAMELKRMQGVLSGEQTGISQSVNWTGGGSFIFFELAKNSQNVLDKIIASNNTDELSAIYDELKSSPFVLYTVDILKMERGKDAFGALTIDEQKKFLISIIDKNPLYINYSEIENGDYFLSDTDKTFTKNFYKED